MRRADTILATSYRYFLAVAEEGSVRQASRRFSVAPSAISRQLGLLEKQLGVMLFERSGRNLHLTSAGETLRNDLRKAAASHVATLDRLDALRGLETGHLRIATVESVSVSILPAILGAFSIDYPGITLEVTVAGSEQVTRQVSEHMADLGFTFNPPALDGLEAVVTRNMQMGAAVSPRHPLARQKSVTLAQCAGFPLAWPSRGLSLRNLLDKVVLKEGSDRPRPVECNSLRLMASLARGGGFVAFQTRIGIEQDIADGHLVFIPLTDARLPPDRLVLLKRAGQGASHASEAFIARARTALPESDNVRKK